MRVWTSSPLGETCPGTCSGDDPGRRGEDCLKGLSRLIPASMTIEVETRRRQDVPVLSLTVPTVTGAVTLATEPQRR